MSMAEFTIHGLTPLVKWFATRKPVEAEQILRAGLGTIVGIAVGMYVKLVKNNKEWLNGW